METKNLFQEIHKNSYTKKKLRAICKKLEFKVIELKNVRWKKNRDHMIKKLQECGIETGIHYKPIHQMSMYNIKRKLPVTENVGKKILSLPTHPNLSNDDVTRIISSVNKFL